MLEYQLNYLGGMDERASSMGMQGGEHFTAGRRPGAESKAGVEAGQPARGLVACCELTPSQCTRQLRKPHARNEGHDCISQMRGGTDLARVTPSSG